MGFKWNTGTPTLEYGLYQIPNATCPLTFTLDPAVKLIISPASSPNVAGIVTATLNAPSTVSCCRAASRHEPLPAPLSVLCVLQYYFADPVNCLKGELDSALLGLPLLRPRTLVIDCAVLCRPTPNGDHLRGCGRCTSPGRCTGRRRCSQQWIGSAATNKHPTGEHGQRRLCTGCSCGRSVADKLNKPSRGGSHGNEDAVEKAFAQPQC